MPSQRLKLKFDVARLGMNRSDTPISALLRLDGRRGVDGVIMPGKPEEGIDTSEVVLLLRLEAIYQLDAGDSVDGVFQALLFTPLQ
jgi:hypothetical protein